MMNERFTKLATEAGFSTWILNPSKETMSDTPELLERFAKLIVNECITQIKKDENGLAYEAVARISDHFGVEICN